MNPADEFRAAVDEFRRNLREVRHSLYVFVALVWLGIVIGAIAMLVASGD